MRLGLSSTALPGAAVEELLDACARRGLAVLELTLQEAQLERERIRRGISATASHGVQVAGVLAERCDDLLELSAVSRELDAPILLAGPGTLQSRIECAKYLEALGGAAFPVVAGGPAAWAEALAVPGLRLAWQVEPGSTDTAGAADLLLEASALAYVRLVGGGPEATLQEGLGVGAAMRQLALASYDGPLVVAPSSTRYRVAWAAWLGRRGGWGCGSATDREPLPLSRLAAEARA